MDPTAVANAVTVQLSLAPVEDGVVSGTPELGWASLGTVAGSEVGVWEITPGVVTDTEVDEVFVVLSGAGVVEFLDGSEPLELTAGSVGRFAAGTRTRWTITSTLRKIYVSA